MVKALLTIAETLEPTDVRWAVTASAGLALQGVDVSPADLDINTDKGGAYEIARLFRECVVTPVRYRRSPRYRSHFGELEIQGVKVEIMGNLRVLREARWSPARSPANRKIIRVDIEGVSIPVVPIALLKRTGYLHERIDRKKGLLRK
jgi:hypothetical protein